MPWKKEDLTWPNRVWAAWAQQAMNLFGSWQMTRLARERLGRLPLWYRVALKEYWQQTEWEFSPELGAVGNEGLRCRKKIFKGYGDMVEMPDVVVEEWSKCEILEREEWTILCLEASDNRMITRQLIQQ